MDFDFEKDDVFEYYLELLRKELDSEREKSLIENVIKTYKSLQQIKGVK